ncbi:MAG: cytidine deaminase [Actinomycetota bacterium]
MDNRELVEIAKKTGENAYAPYSNFKVGAALLTKSGNVYQGCNIENSSYGLTICAERAAISNAVSNGEKEFTKMAIVGGFAEKQNETLLTPCGACMQIMSEFNPDLELILLNTVGKIITINLKELFPKPFKL